MFNSYCIITANIFIVAHLATVGVLCINIYAYSKYHYGEMLSLKLYYLYKPSRPRMISVW